MESNLYVCYEINCKSVFAQIVCCCTCTEEKYIKNIALLSIAYNYKQLKGKTEMLGRGER